VLRIVTQALILWGNGKDWKPEEQKEHQYQEQHIG
jgi:hypothetical protein